MSIRIVSSGPSLGRIKRTYASSGRCHNCAKRLKDALCVDEQGREYTTHLAYGTASGAQLCPRCHEQGVTLPDFNPYAARPLRRPRLLERIYALTHGFFWMPS